MNRDPFLRLALIAACSLYWLGLALVAVWLGWGALIYVAIGGIAGAFAVTYERGPSSDEPVEELRQRRRQPAEGTRGFERIER